MERFLFLLGKVRICQLFFERIDGLGAGINGSFIFLFGAYQSIFIGIQGILLRCQFVRSTLISQLFLGEFVKGALVGLLFFLKFCGF